MYPESFIQNYKSALASKNWNLVHPLIHTNVCITFSNGEVHKGIDAVKKAFTTNFTLIENDTYAMSNIEWIMKETNYAIFVFNFAWSGQIKGQQASGSGRGTICLVFENGTWLLLVEHLCTASI